MADGKKKYSLDDLDNILPERKETFESFYQAITSCGSEISKRDKGRDSNICKNGGGSDNCNR